MMKRMGPRTEPWGTPQERGSEEERLFRQETEEDLYDIYDWNHVAYAKPGSKMMEQDGVVDCVEELVDCVKCQYKHTF